MRLKGGKVLLDLTGYGDLKDVDISHSLSDEEIKSIKEKGLCILVKAIGHVISLDLVINDIHESYLSYQTLTIDSTSYTLVLDISNKRFEITSA